MFLAQRGIEDSTRSNYDSHFKYWQEYCDWGLIDPLEVCAESLINFIAWCYCGFASKKLNSNHVDKALTAVVSWLKDQGVSFDRKKYPAIKRHLDGYRKERPPKRRHKKPFCGVHVKLTFRHCINCNRYSDVMTSTGMLLGYEGLLY